MHLLVKSMHIHCFFNQYYFEKIFDFLGGVFRIDRNQQRQLVFPPFANFVHKTRTHFIYTCFAITLVSSWYKDEAAGDRK